jgi:hypothetical protein
VSRAADERRYLRAVEAAWSKASGRATVVSPREFEAIDSWRRRGIPLSVVLEVIATAGKRRSGKSLRGLTSIAHDVLGAWAVVAAGRTAQTVAPAAPARGGDAHPWGEALERSSEGTPLHALISDLLNRAAAGDDAASLDAELDRSLENAAPQDLCDATRRDVTLELATFRERMNGEEFQTMLRRALVDRLRASLSLPRLALTR